MFRFQNRSYETYRDDDGNPVYATVGYTTVYLYYSYPDNLRPRISQMLVLPPFQRLGLGTRFLRLIYAQYTGDARVRDITVEDPSEEFRRIRNVVDVQRCAQLPAFAVGRLEAAEGFSAEMRESARERLKICARQARVVYEILRLDVLDRGDADAYRSYRLAVKKRLNLAYYRQRQDVVKMERMGIDPQWMRAQMPTLDERLEQLSGEYVALEAEYEAVLKTVDRMAAAAAATAQAAHGTNGTKENGD